MRTGRLSQRVDIEEWTIDLSAPAWSSGSQSEAWIHIKTVWANIRHMKGSEIFAAGAVLENEIVTIATRKLAAPYTYSKVLRFKFRDSYYKVREIDDTTSNAYWYFTCERMEQ